MQSLTGKSDRRFQRFAFGGFGRFAVHPIPQQRVSQRRHMNAHLMRAPRFQRTFDQTDRPVFKRRQRAVMRFRALAARFQNRHFLPVQRTAPDLRFNDAPRRIRTPPHQRQIAPFQTVDGELSGQAVVRGVVFGDHHQPAGVLVQPVYDAGARDAADSRQGIPAMRQKRVHQSVVAVARRGVDDHARRFVQNQQIVVFVHDVQRNVLRLGNGGGRLRNFQPVHFARDGFTVPIRNDGAVRRHRPPFDQGGNPAARQSGAQRQPFVQPRFGFGGIDGGGCDDGVFVFDHAPTVPHARETCARFFCAFGFFSFRL